MIKRGFGIAETLIASTIIASLVLAFMGITNVINHAASLSYQQSVAADLAQQRIEIARAQVERAWNNSRATTDPISDAEWAQFVTNDSTPQESDPIDGIVYSTKVTITHEFSDLPPLYAANETGSYVTGSASNAVSLYRKVHVDVAWDDGGAQRSYALETVITNWREGVL